MDVRPRRRRTQCIHLPKPAQASSVTAQDVGTHESRLVCLANEEVDYGNPSVTAKDVLDRDGLKAFVTQTGNQHIARLQAGGLEAAPS